MYVQHSCRPGYMSPLLLVFMWLFSDVEGQNLVLLILYRVTKLFYRTFHPIHSVMPYCCRIHKIVLVNYSFSFQAKV